MSLLVVSTLLVSYASFLLFNKLGWTTENYQGKAIPYHLGLIILFSFFSFSSLLASKDTEWISYSLIYLLIIWVVGFIDDRFGDCRPKGIKGHLTHFVKTGRISTGLLKVMGTLVAALSTVYFLQPTTLENGMRFLLLLLLAPHIMNLFDTRPLRVWKVTIVHLGTLLPFLPFFAPSIYVYVSIVLFIIYFLEGRKLAMLGDNGATTIGGVLALLLIHNGNMALQWGGIFVYLLLTTVAERYSFTFWIDKVQWLRKVDRWGVS